jgi:hypothetical protein
LRARWLSGGSLASIVGAVEFVLGELAEGVGDGVLTFGPAGR